MALHAQAQPATPHSVAPVTAENAEEVYPDEGFLSPQRYVSRYFGFAFDLPPDAHWRPVHNPVASDGHLQLLELAGPSPQRAVISVTAYARRDKNDPDAKQMLRRELDNELFYGVEELRGLSKTTIAKHQFFLYRTRRGIDEHLLLATDLDGYVLHVAIAVHDEKMMKELETSFAAAIFFDPSQARQYAGADAKAYDGPAMSAHRLAALKADPPANHLDPGKVVAGEYQNNDLGLSYALPADWTIGKTAAVEPAVERARARSALDIDGSNRPWMGSAERELVKACKKILFSAWKERPAPDGSVTYDDFGEVTLSAMSQACFPDMTFPATNADAAGIQAFLAQFSLTHPLLREMRQGKAFESGGKLFVVTEGVVAFQTPGEDLSRRLSIAMATTSQHGYLLTWFFAAPHDSELRELMNANVSLAPEAVPNRAKTAEVAAGGGTPAPSPAQPVSAPATSPAAPAAAATAAPGGDAPPPPGQPASPATTAADSVAPAAATSPATESSTATTRESRQPAGADPQLTSPPPTLLRPGETMQDQQMKGAPVPKKH